MQLLASGILNLDKDHSPSRINARGGLGALMGSKRIKAIIFDPATRRVPAPADPQAYQSARKRFTLALDKHPQTAVYRDFGTAAMAHLANRLGGLPTRSFRSGSFESVENISGEHLRAELLRRGKPADPSHACMPGCLIRCSNTFTDEDGQEVVSPLEYETIALMGSNLGIDSLDAVARLNRAANDLGLDSIEVGAAIGRHDGRRSAWITVTKPARWRCCNEVYDDTPWPGFGAWCGSHRRSFWCDACPGCQTPGNVGL
jgi:aldehyde:ferredoxin oxidoreductase